MRERERERDSPCLNDKAAKKNPAITRDNASGKDCTRDIKKVSSRLLDNPLNEQFFPCRSFELPF